MRTEEWRPIEGWEGYEISDLGRVRSFKGYHGRIIKTFKILKQSIKRNGYACVMLRNMGEVCHTSVHRHVCIAFLDKIPNKDQVNHKNCIKSDNRLENLEWCNSSENQLHAISNGLINNGRRRVISKYTQNDEYICSYESATEAHRQTNILRSCISAAAIGVQHTAGGFKWKYA